MNRLIITLKGEIQHSNFPEWKSELLGQIECVNTELHTDDDFVEAIRQVKLFKASEEYLSNAKQSALNQSSDVQKLFAAIDEISQRARQTRLLLERQINFRKLAIKNEKIQAGIAAIQSFIAQRSVDFHLLNHDIFLNRNRFESAVKGKAGVNGIQIAIDSLCDEIKDEILEKAAETDANALTIDTLPTKYKLLFQDRGSLISLETQELNLVIEERISLFDKEGNKASVEQSHHVHQSDSFDKFQPSQDEQLIDPISAKHERFRLIVDMFASENMAKEIARSFKSSHRDKDCILSIKLSRYHD